LGIGGLVIGGLVIGDWWGGDWWIGDWWIGDWWIGGVVIGDWWIVDWPRVLRENISKERLSVFKKLERVQKAMSIAGYAPYL